MRPIHVRRTIDASVRVVFTTIADARNFQKAVPNVERIVFLSDQRIGTGTKFQETRTMNGRESTVELEVAEYIENERVRMISDAGGTIWDTMFAVQPGAEHVVLDVTMDIRPHTFLARLMTPFIRGMVAKAVEADMDSVKAFCESQPG